MTLNINRQANFKFSIDKILFIIASTYLVMVIFWLVSQGKLKLPGMANSSKQPTSQQQTLSSNDAQFIAYLQQSLEILEQKRQQQTAKANSPSNPTPTQTIKIPPPPLPSSPPSATSTPPRVVEKIYIPVYPQIQQPSVAVNSSSSAIPVKPPSPTRLTVPPPPPLRVSSQRQPQTQVPKAPSTVPVLTPGDSLLPEAPPLTGVANKFPTSSTKNTGILLVGLLEAGDKSSALFTIENKTRRVQIGEGIGTTGWMLTSVENQQVIITRNGTLRSLAVGQNF